MNTEIAAMSGVFGAKAPQEIFNSLWGKYLAPGNVITQDQQVMTRSVKDIMNATPDLAQRKGGVHKRIDEMRKKQMVFGDIAAGVPVMWEPEVVHLLDAKTPLLASLEARGYMGRQVSVNNISARAAPRGEVSEANSLDLSGVSNGFTLAQVTANMGIYVDACETSDFGQYAADHYMDFRETNLGERVKQYFLHTERVLIYGDPTRTGTTGDPFDGTAFTGIKQTCSAAGTLVDKSGVSISPVVDIANEVAAMRQSLFDIDDDDLTIWVSHTMHRRLERLIRHPIIQINENVVNYGFPQLFIDQVPVRACRQLRQHTFAPTAPPNTEGSAGDVVIVNNRADKMYYLAPLFIVPLARIGLSERTGLGAFRTYLNRAAGNFSRFLQNYPLA